MPLLSTFMCHGLLEQPFETDISSHQGAVLSLQPSEVESLQVKLDWVQVPTYQVYTLGTPCWVLWTLGVFKVSALRVEHLRLIQRLAMSAGLIASAWGRDSVISIRSLENKTRREEF